MTGFRLHEKGREGRLYTVEIALFFIAAALSLSVDALQSCPQRDSRDFFVLSGNAKSFFFSLLNYEMLLQWEAKESHQLICFSSVLALDFSSLCLFCILN